MTLAVEAALACLDQVEPLTFGGIFFASMTSPFRQHQVASSIATACDLPRDILSCDFSGSERAGLAALAAGLRAVDGGIRKVLVVAADRGVADRADGAVALVVDGRGLVARHEAGVAVAEDLSFQAAGLGRSSERSFRDLAEVIERVVNEHGVGPDEVAALALGGLESAVTTRLVDMVGVGPARSFHASEGAQAMATPEPLYRLGCALAAAESDRPLVVAAEGAGAEALLFTRAAGGAMQRVDVPTGNPAQPAAAEVVGPAVWPASGEGGASEPGASLLIGEVDQQTRLYGSRCAACQGVDYPARLTCSSCGAETGLEPAKLAKSGRVLQACGPNRVRVELDEGATIELDATGALESAESGAAVRLTLRRATTGPLRYTWKARAGASRSEA